MSITDAGIDAIFNAVVSHAAATGRFERVNQHEPQNAPGNGLTAAVWIDDLVPVLSSGLATTSALLVFNVRIFGSMLAEPQDGIDPKVTAAACALFVAYAGDFELGGNVRCVDIRGMANGTQLRARAGYLSQDGKFMRVMTITLPVIVNDAFDEAA